MHNVLKWLTCHPRSRTARTQAGKQFEIGNKSQKVREGDATIRENPLMKVSLRAAIACVPLFTWTQLKTLAFLLLESAYSAGYATCVDAGPFSQEGIIEC